MACNGVARLANESLVFTGRVYIDGAWWEQGYCRDVAEQCGALTQRSFSGGTTVVVWGDLHSQVVTDPKSMRSEKLIRATEATRHVHVIDPDGFSRLLDGLPARCLLAAVRRGRVPTAPKGPPRVFGGHLEVQVPKKTNHAKFLADLDGLDRGSRAHAQTLQKLQRFLASRGIPLLRPATGGPLFDAGWRARGAKWVAEVKSVSDGPEAQQLRLGLGQVLDYRGRLSTHGVEVKAALVTSRQPSDPTWSRICAEAGVMLTWAPGFPGL